MSLKWENTGLKTPMARVQGLGSAKSGSDSWVRLRVTAIANIPLVIWFVWFVKQSVGLPHAEFTALLAQPWNAVAMILFIVSVFWHALLGCREIVEDYIHLEWFRLMKLVGMYLFFFAAAVVCLFCVLKIALAGV